MRGRPSCDGNPRVQVEHNHLSSQDDGRWQRIHLSTSRTRHKRLFDLHEGLKIRVLVRWPRELGAAWEMIESRMLCAIIAYNSKSDWVNVTFLEIKEPSGVEERPAPPAHHGKSFHLIARSFALLVPSHCSLILIARESRLTVLSSIHRSGHGTERQL